MAGASVSGTTTWESQILSYSVFIVPNDFSATKRHRNQKSLCLLCFFVAIPLGCIGHPNIITDQLAHFFGRNDPLFRFFAPGPALEIGSAITAAQHFHNRALQLDRLARQFE